MMKQKMNHSSTKTKKNKTPNNVCSCRQNMKSILKHRETSIDRSYFVLSFLSDPWAYAQSRKTKTTNLQKYEDLNYYCTLPLLLGLITQFTLYIESTTREKLKMRADQH